MTETNAKISPQQYQELAELTAHQVSDGRADGLSTTLFFKLLRMGNRLSKDFEVAIRQRADLSFAGYQLMFTLKAVGELTSNQLARLASVSTASMSSLLNTMERKGLVEREADTIDRRRTIICLTEQGQSMMESLYLGNMDRELAWSQGLTRDEAEILSDLVEKLLLHRPRPVGEAPENFEYWKPPHGANAPASEHL